MHAIWTNDYIRVIKPLSLEARNWDESAWIESASDGGKVYRVEASGGVFVGAIILHRQKNPESVVRKDFAYLDKQVKDLMNKVYEEEKLLKL